MFESAELGHRVGKAQYEEDVPALRAALLDAQFDLRETGKFAVVVLVNGVDAAGKGETVNLLNEWLDPRHILTWAVDATRIEAHDRPRMWRFWRMLPGKGRIGILFGNWYEALIEGRVAKRVKRSRLDQRLDEINRFEAMLADEGVLLIKFWFHLSRDRQKARLKKLAADPLTRWRVTDHDWCHFKHYRRRHNVAERVLRQTSSAAAPWIIVDGSDPRYRSLLVGKTLLAAISKRLDNADISPPRLSTAPMPPRLSSRSVLGALQLDQPLDKKDYRHALERLQGRLAMLTRRDDYKKHSLVLVFEGMDAAGKGGAIRRLTGGLDARHYQVVPVAAPTDEENAQPYLWRFWRHAPPRGKAVIFDRSWYGRVLVERVEGFCTEADWMRAYGEINDFEDALADAGAVVVKFWLSISLDEQLARFEARTAEPHKRFKITDEDWRNRESWPSYERAVCDMIDRTSTERSPWTLIEADNKRYARIKVLRTVCERLEAALG